MYVRICTNNTKLVLCMWEPAELMVHADTYILYMTIRIESMQGSSLCNGSFSTEQDRCVCVCLQECVYVWARVCACVCVPVVWCIHLLWAPVSWTCDVVVRKIPCDHTAFDFTAFDFTAVVYIYISKHPLVESLPCIMESVSYSD